MSRGKIQIKMVVHVFCNKRFKTVFPSSRCQQSWFWTSSQLLTCFEYRADSFVRSEFRSLWKQVWSRGTLLEDAHRLGTCGHWGSNLVPFTWEPSTHYTFLPHHLFLFFVQPSIPVKESKVVCSLPRLTLIPLVSGEDLDDDNLKWWW